MTLHDAYFIVRRSPVSPCIEVYERPWWQRVLLVPWAVACGLARLVWGII